MDPLKEIGIVALLTIGGIFLGDYSLSCIRSSVYDSQIVKIEKIKDSQKRDFELKRYKQGVEDSRTFGYTLFGVVGGLVGLCVGIGAVSASNSTVSKDSSIYDSARTAGEHYMGIG